jgi:hypothetical protein
MLVAAPAMVLLGFRWPFGRVVVSDCNLSTWPFAWPFTWPLRLPLRAPLEAAFLGFFARPLAWAAIFAAECQSAALLSYLAGCGDDVRGLSMAAAWLAGTRQRLRDVLRRTNTGGGCKRAAREWQPACDR